MTDSKPIFTRNKLRAEIRKMCKLPLSSKQFFSRVEMIAIIRTLYPDKGRWITNDTAKATFCAVQKLPEIYLKDIWNKQISDNAHPTKTNLLAIYGALKKKSSEPQTATIPTPKENTQKLKNQVLTITKPPFGFGDFINDIIKTRQSDIKLIEIDTKTNKFKIEFA